MRLALLFVLAATSAQAQTFGGVFGGGGSGGGAAICTLDGSTEGLATSYRATTTTGTAFQADAVLACSFDTGPGTNNCIGTDSSGRILLGPDNGGSGTIVKISGSLEAGNGAIFNGPVDMYLNGYLFSAFTAVRVTDPDGLVINSTTAIKGVVRSTVVIDFPSIANGSCSIQTATVTGATLGDAVSVNADFLLPADVGIGNARVTATNSVDIRLCNHNGASAQDPASGTFIVRLER